MSESKPKYCVFGNEYVLFMNGDREDTKAQHSEDEFIFYGDSFEECRAAAKKWAEGQEAPRVIHYSGGIGSIVYDAADVYENEYDDDGDLLEAPSTRQARSPTNCGTGSRGPSAPITHGSTTSPTATKRYSDEC